MQHQEQYTKPCPACGKAMPKNRGVCPECGQMTGWFKFRLALGCVGVLFFLGGVALMLVLAMSS